MYILTIDGRESEGAYSVQNEEGENILYLFEEQDDAVRYAMMLEEKDYPEMHVMEVDPAAMLSLCQNYDYEYTIITANDIVIPPDIEYDTI
tara:strand:+ start:118 stop:390 length:273 start_codon:yes stop_codon:yes gene_type:complete